MNTRLEIKIYSMSFKARRAGTWQIENGAYGRMRLTTTTD
jgi:hypothetical protein